MDFHTILFETDDDGIARITINRPDKHNAIDGQVMTELDQAFRRAKADRAVRAVVLTGAGDKSFVAGADIGQFTALDARSGNRFALRGQAVFGRIEEMPKPVVAAVNGYALGGGFELALACHLRVAAENAVFGLPEVGLGILPGYGGTQRLPRIVGRTLAAEIILTGDRFDARRAFEMGLVNRVVPSGQAVEEAHRLAATIATRAPLAVSMALEALRTSGETSLSQGLRYEAALFGQACATEDFREGVAAYQERRKAAFKGR